MSIDNHVLVRLDSIAKEFTHMIKKIEYTLTLEAGFSRWQRPLRG